MSNTKKLEKQMFFLGILTKLDFHVCIVGNKGLFDYSTQLVIIVLTSGL